MIKLDKSNIKMRIARSQRVRLRLGSVFTFGALCLSLTLIAFMQAQADLHLPISLSLSLSKAKRKQNQKNFQRMRMRTMTKAKADPNPNSISFSSDEISQQQSICVKKRSRTQQAKDQMKISKLRPQKQKKMIGLRQAMALILGICIGALQSASLSSQFYSLMHYWNNKDSQTFKQAIYLASLFIVVCGIAENITPTAYGKFGIDKLVKVNNKNNNNFNSINLKLNPHLGWFLMEFPCWFVFVYQYFVVGGPQSAEFVPTLLACMFLMHYIYRGFIFPYLIRVHAGSGSGSGSSKNFSILPAFGSWMVTTLHAYLSAKWYAEYGTHLVYQHWLRNPIFIVGFVTYLIGFFLTIWHDKIQRELRPKPGKKNNQLKIILQNQEQPHQQPQKQQQRYSIPHGALFDYVTSAGYFSELIAWFGFFLMGGCGPNGFYIFLVSLVNLVPRSGSTHRWYLEKFGERYEKLGRKKLVPGLW